MKYFRKPIHSLILALLIIFSNCSKPNNVEEIDISAIEDYVHKHIAITDKMIEIINKDDKSNIEMLSKSPDVFNSIDEFKQFLEKANFSKSSEITNLYVELEENTSNYAKIFENFNKEDIINVVNIEINRQFDNKNLEVIKLTSAGRDVCGDNFIRARGRCSRNYAIGAAAVTVSGFFTLGVGTVVGLAAVIAAGALCYNDASDDFAACRAN